MSVEWGDGSVRAYGDFAREVNREAMSAELREIFERYRPQFVAKNATLSIGSGVNGCMLYVPREAGREAMEVVRKYFAEALGAEGKASTRNEETRVRNEAFASRWKRANRLGMARGKCGHF